MYSQKNLQTPNYPLDDFIAWLDDKKYLYQYK